MKIYFPNGLGRVAGQYEVLEVVKDPGFITTDMAIINAAGRVVCVAKDGPYLQCSDDYEVGSIVSAPTDGVDIMPDTPIGEEMGSGTEPEDNTYNDTVVDSINDEDDGKEE